MYPQGKTKLRGVNCKIGYSSYLKQPQQSGQSGLFRVPWYFTREHFQLKIGQPASHLMTERFWKLKIPYLLDFNKELVVIVIGC